MSFFTNSSQFSVGTLTIYNVGGNQNSYHYGALTPLGAAGSAHRPVNEFVDRPVLSIGMLKRIVTTFSAPFLTSSRENLLLALEALSELQKNRELLTNLLLTAIQIVATINTHFCGDASNGPLSMEDLEQCLKNIRQCVKEGGQRNWIFRAILPRGHITRRVVALEKKMEEIFHGFEIGPLISMQDIVHPGLTLGTESQRYSQASRDIIAKFIVNEDIRAIIELSSGPKFDVYSARHDGRLVVVKEFHGSRAKECLKQALLFHHNVVNPYFLHLKGTSSPVSAVHFVVFDDACSASFEIKVASALQENQTRSIRLALTIVGGISAALRYLFRKGIPSVPFLEEKLDIYITDDDELKVGFDSSGLDIIEEEENIERVEDVRWSLLNNLCLRTFKQANRFLYQDESFRLEQSVTLEPSRTSAVSAQTVPIQFGIPLEGSTVPSNLRRELIWKVSPRWKVSSRRLSTVALVAQHYQDYLGRLQIDGLQSLTLRHFQARPEESSRPRHTCPGYRKERITLTTDVSELAIINHSTPSISEICLVCGQTVRRKGVFQCQCGSSDDGLFPTIQCCVCSSWSHLSCAGTFKPFSCRSCLFTVRYQFVLFSKITSNTSLQPGARVWYWNARGGVQYGTVLSCTLGDSGSHVLNIRDDNGSNLRLPAASLTRVR